MNSIKQSPIEREYIRTLIEQTGLKTTITDFQSILDVVWTNVFKMPKFDSYIKKRIRTCPGIISSIDSLDGIKELCEIQDYADVYLLIRKLRDNLFLDLFLFEAQKTFERIPYDSFKNVNLNNIEEVIDSVSNFYLLCINSERTSKELKAINKWKNSEFLMSNEKCKRNYFQFDKYVCYLKENNEDFKVCYDTFLKTSFSLMSLKLNDYAHSNSESVLISKQNPLAILRDIKETLMNLEQLFIVSLFFVDSLLFVSDDYEDYIESNLTPPEEAQYFVNGYILDVFIEIKSNHKELFHYLVEHNKHLMKIDCENS